MSRGVHEASLSPTLGRATLQLLALPVLSLLYDTVEGLGEWHLAVEGTGTLPFSHIYWWLAVNSLERSEERHSASLPNSV